MYLWRPRYGKPPIGSTLVKGHPLLVSMIYFAPLNEGEGVIHEILNARPNITQGGLTTTMWGTGPAGNGLYINAFQWQITGAMGSVLQGQITIPCSIAVGLAWIGAPNTSSMLFGASLNNTNATPFDAIGFRTNASQQPILSFSSGATYYTIANTTAPTQQIPYVYSGTLTATNQYLYLNGYQIGTSANALTTFSWGTNSSIYFGNAPAGNVNSRINVAWGALWNRALAPNEHQWMGQSVNAIYEVLAPAENYAQKTTIVPRRSASMGILAGVH